MPTSSCIRKNKTSDIFLQRIHLCDLKKIEEYIGIWNFRRHSIVEVLIAIQKMFVWMLNDLLDDMWEGRKVKPCAREDFRKKFQLAVSELMLYLLKWETIYPKKEPRNKSEDAGNVCKFYVASCLCGPLLQDLFSVFAWNTTEEFLKIKSPLQCFFGIMYNFMFLGGVTVSMIFL